MAAFRPDPPRPVSPVTPRTDAPRGIAAPVARVIEAFRRLPGIGPKSAQRLAYHLVRMPEAEAAELSEAITGVKQRIMLCETCADITEATTCHICTDPNRDRSTICVVEEPLDVAAFERTRTYDGLYHVLHGAISPTSGIAASDLKIKELLQRLQVDTANQTVTEVIVATNTNLDGEATAMYLQRAITPAGIKVTRPSPRPPLRHRHRIRRRRNAGAFVGVAGGDWLERGFRGDTPSPSPCEGEEGAVSTLHSLI